LKYFNRYSQIRAYFLPTFFSQISSGFAAIIQTLPYSPLRVVVLLGKNTNEKDREEEVKEGALF